MPAQERYEEAEPLNRRALAIAEKVYGCDHREVALARQTRAVLLKEQVGVAEVFLQMGCV